MPNNDVLKKKIDLANQKIDRYEKQISEIKLLMENEQRMIDHYAAQITDED